MNSRLAQHRDRRGRMKKIFITHADLITPQEDIQEKLDDFLTGDKAWEKDEETIDGLADNEHAGTKSEAYTAMIGTASRWGQRCKEQATDLGLSTLAGQLDHDITDFMHLDGAAQIDLAKMMRNALNDHLADFKKQKLTKNAITDLDSKIKAAEEWKDVPVTVRNTLSTLRKKHVADDAALELKLEKIVGLLEAEYRDSNKLFVAELMRQYTLGSYTGRRYTGLEGMVKSATGNPLTGYTVCRADNHSKASVTDMEGTFSIKGMRSGQVTFELISPENAVVDTKIVQLKLGTMVALNWVV